MSSFDQACLQLQLLAQAAFLPCHLAMVVLMIEARQMQNAVQHQNFNLVRDGML